MMKTVKADVAYLSGAALDWAVAKAISAEVYAIWGGLTIPVHFCPSKCWSICGPLIERMKVQLEPPGPNPSWTAKTDGRVSIDSPSNYSEAVGLTPLVAACRAIVSARIGVSVDVPVELVEN